MENQIAYSLGRKVVDYGFSMRSTDKTRMPSAKPVQ